MAGLKKQFHKATQVRAGCVRYPRCVCSARYRPLEAESRHEFAPETDAHVRGQTLNALVYEFVKTARDLRGTGRRHVIPKYSRALCNRPRALERCSPEEEVTGLTGFMV